MYCIISKYKLIQSISGRRCLNFLMMCIQTVVQQSRVQFPSTLFHLWSNFVQYLSLWSEKDVTNKRGLVWPIKTHQIVIKTNVLYTFYWITFNKLPKPAGSSATDGGAVLSYTKNPRFEISHWQFLFNANCIEKIKLSCT